MNIRKQYEILKAIESLGEVADVIYDHDYYGLPSHLPEVDQNKVDPYYENLREQLTQLIRSLEAQIDESEAKPILKRKTKQKKYSDQEDESNELFERIIELAIEKTGWSSEEAVKKWKVIALNYVSGRISRTMPEMYYVTYIPEESSLEKGWVIEVESGKEISNLNQLKYLLEHVNESKTPFVGHVVSNISRLLADFQDPDVMSNCGQKYIKPKA